MSGGLMTNLEDLRIRLDQMSERIVSRLKDRSRLPSNPPVYIPDAVPIENRSGISFLKFAIEGLEVYHASLGRYEYSDQHPILGVSLPKSSITRIGTTTELSREEIKYGDTMLAFYNTIPPELCQNGNEPKTYGETVYIDADLIELMHERINTIGRYVAQSKFDTNPNILKTVGDDVLIREALRNVKREDSVVEQAKETSAKYNLDPKITERVFRWLIKETVNVEVSYLKCLARSDPNTTTKTKILTKS